MAVTPPEPPSSLLERAAQRLEMLADLTTQGAWKAAPHPHTPDKANVVIEVAQQTGGFVASLFNSSCCGGNCYGHVEHGDDAIWIATMSPAIAAPLAKWLRGEARYCERFMRRDWPGLEVWSSMKVARAILGEPVPGEDK